MTHDSSDAEIRGPVQRAGGQQVVPNSTRPASILSQALLLEHLILVADHVRGRLLDVGCGMKPYEWLYRERVTEYMGCDHPGQSSQSEALDVYADAQTLPFQSESFDTILCTEVLEHLPNPGQCVQELSRLLCPGGKLILTTPFLYWLHEQPRDYYRYTPYGLEHLVRIHGLEMIYVGTRGNIGGVLTDLWAKWLHHMLIRLAPRFGSRTIPNLALLGVTLPQHVYLGMHSWLRTFPNSLRRQIRAFFLAESVALGYVVVAQRPTTGSR